MTCVAAGSYGSMSPRTVASVETKPPQPPGACSGGRGWLENGIRRPAGCSLAPERNARAGTAGGHPTTNTLQRTSVRLPRLSKLIRQHTHLADGRGDSGGAPSLETAREAADSGDAFVRYDCGNLHRHAAKELRTMSSPEPRSAEEALVAYLLGAGFVLGHDVRLAEVEGG